MTQEEKRRMAVVNLQIPIGRTYKKKIIITREGLPFADDTWDIISEIRGGEAKTSSKLSAFAVDKTNIALTGEIILELGEDDSDSLRGKGYYDVLMKPPSGTEAFTYVGGDILFYHVPSDEDAP